MVQKRLLRGVAGAGALGAIVLGSAGFVSRNTPQPRPAAPPRAGSAHVLNYVNVDSGLFPQTMDPANVTDSQSIQVLPMLYGNLVKLNTNNQVVPDLAQSFTMSPNGLTYTFKLRNTKFSDGKPVTAADVVYSLDRALNPKVYQTGAGKFGASPVAGTYLGHILGASSYKGSGDVKGLKAVNSSTVQITLDSPIAFFLQTLSYPTGDILEKGKTPIGGLVPNNPMQNQVSSGPFKISAYRYKSSITFVPNPGFYNAGKMKLKEVDMPFTPSFDSSYTGFRSGEYAMGSITANRLPSSRSLPDFHQIAILGIDYISYNFNRAPFNNANLRKAMSYAINRELICNGVLKGSEVPLYSVVPKGIPGFDTSGKQYTPSYNPTMAKRYLALAKKQMGASFPSTILIKYQNSGTDLAREYVELQNEWKAVGLNVKVQSIDFNSWLNLVNKSAGGHEQWVENAWLDDYPDAQDFTTNLLSPATPYNIGNYNSAEFNRLTNQALTARGSERGALYVKASRIALNDVAWSTIGQNVYSWRWSQNIKGMTMWSGELYPVPQNNDWTSVDVQ